ncbi:MAG: response regulator [Candidatus Sericytochromatia bacterium]|nr:response regulator [Candidatus Tanganyikabacteria bacterium]
MKGRIVIVDDNPAGARLAAYVLECEGFAVKVADRPENGLELIREWRPDLVLMDLQLPGISGLELTRLLKADENTAGIVIVALSAYVRLEDRDQAQDAGCDGFIAKPIDTRAFPAQVASFLEKPL